VLKDVLSQWSPTADARVPVPQVGALPYSVLENRVVFLLITSRRTGRWIFPKGGLIEGLTPWDAAAREAFEEAGVEGQVQSETLGVYRTSKSDLRRTLLEVTMYPLRVDLQHDEWPESGQRHRHWAALPEARRLLADKGLMEMASTLSQQLVGKPQTLIRSRMTK